MVVPLEQGASPVFDGRLLLVGAGNMGGAMLDGWLAAGQDGALVTVLDPHVSDARRRAWEERAVQVTDRLPTDAPHLLMLAVKPQAIDAVMAHVRPAVHADMLVASVAAGVGLRKLEDGTGARRCVRVMPNTPSQVARGVSVCCATADVDAAARDAVTGLMAAVGAVEWIEDEALMDAVTAVSGSGPAYAFHLAEALAAAGERAGLPADLALRLATATVSGAGELMHRSDEPPARLRKAVTSPGGTTEAGLAVLQAELPDLMARTVAAAAKRSRELA